MATLINKYDGMRKLTISSRQSDGTRIVATLLGNKVGSDGLELDASAIEQSVEAFESTYSKPVGVEIKPGTAHLIPYDIEDMGKILPIGYDQSSNTWSMVMEACALDDVTLAFEKVCPNSDGSHGVNYIFRHAAISIASKATIKRAATTVLDLSFYPTPVPGSEYGLTGDLSSKMVAWQQYYGTYDGTTDKVTFDTKPAQQDTKALAQSTKA